jgi:hypothetical protein
MVVVRFLVDPRVPQDCEQNLLLFSMCGFTWNPLPQCLHINVFLGLISLGRLLSILFAVYLPAHF